MTRRKSDISYTQEETRQRFEAALRGARDVGHTPMKNISPKRPKTQRRPKNKSTAST
jgi:hypothetical protein